MHYTLHIRYRHQGQIKELRVVSHTDEATPLDYCVGVREKGILTKLDEQGLEFEHVIPEDIRSIKVIVDK